MPGLSAPQQPSAAPPALAVQVLAGLRGAVLLARGRAAGIAFTCLSPEGAARSFWAAVFCLPAFLLLRLVSGAAGEIGTDPLRFLVAELSGFVCSWVGYALASYWLAARAGLLARWPRFIAAWNWANIVQYVALLVLLPVPPGMVATWLGIAAFGYAMWLEWFVAREALGVNAFQAATFVALDLAISIFLAGAVQAVAMVD
ncbi:hypothetical protein [Roseomonas gilardii]|uniref:hypothetical protein n=1 Tax=Roseomonas gilardii TaxID=257708 RepID=UPI001643A070|nr:hypothetical protein [Roseomonas gilardii]